MSGGTTVSDMSVEVFKQSVEFKNKASLSEDNCWEWDDKGGHEKRHRVFY